MGRPYPPEPRRARDKAPGRARQRGHTIERSERPRARRRGLWGWAKHAIIAGAALSLLVHVIGAVTAALVMLRFSAADAGGDEDTGEVRFAVMSRAELAQIEASAPSAETPAAPSLTPTDAPAVDLLDVSAAGALAAMTQAPLDADLSLGGGDLEAADGLDALGGGGAGGASFFGLEAQGSRFAYIVDVSASMIEEAKMDRLRVELVRSVLALPETGEFSVALYSTNAWPLLAPLRWLDTSAGSKDRFRAAVLAVQAGGGTQPLGAFEMVYRGLDPLPDAIYFMTDGEFSSADVPDTIAGFNRRHRIPIHCVMFGQVSPSATIRDAVRNDLRRIARESGGQFTHITGP